MSDGQLYHDIKTTVVLFGALFANLSIALAKFVAAAIGGSSSMLSEGIHSLVDSGNQILLLHPILDFSCRGNPMLHGKLRSASISPG